jgi:2-oxoglutarate ferredoxin oxidoreductase subunit alpha
MEKSSHSVIMIAGDSGDGIQLSGQQLTYAHARFGHMVQNISDFPAEIRAPAGTIHGVSAFRMVFGNKPIGAVPFYLDYAVVLNPAAYLVLQSRCTSSTIIFFDQDQWSEKDWRKAGLASNPLDGHRGKIMGVPFQSLTIKTCAPMIAMKAKKNRNILALGLILWVHDLPLEPTLEWLQQRFGAQLELLPALQNCLKAGYHLGETLELGQERKSIASCVVAQGIYAQMSGHQSLVLGMVAAAQSYKRPVILSGYPITPASEILHIAQRWSDCGIEVLQAEDEISAAGIALGAAYAGALGVTCTSGPGLDLKAEMIGLAAMAEFPIVIIDVQRSGPSTGMPTKTEQTDLLAALYGRHGECRVPILAQSRPDDGQAIIQRAFEWAIAAMTPVIVLSDAILALGSLPVRLQTVNSMESFENRPDLQAFDRLPNGARPWVAAGTEGKAYCIGGLEKDRITGEISYEADNHEQMVHLRRQKIEHLSSPMQMPLYEPKSKRYLWICYGGASGSVQDYHDIYHDAESTYIVLRDIYPLPSNFWTICREYSILIVAEMADAQLASYLKSYALHPNIISYTQINGQSLDIVRMHDWFINAKERVL